MYSKRMKSKYILIWIFWPIVGQVLARAPRSLVDRHLAAVFDNLCSKNWIINIHYPGLCFLALQLSAPYHSTYMFIISNRQTYIYPYLVNLEYNIRPACPFPSNKCPLLLRQMLRFSHHTIVASMRGILRLFARCNSENLICRQYRPGCCSLTAQLQHDDYNLDICSLYCRPSCCTVALWPYRAVEDLEMYRIRCAFILRS